MQLSYEVADLALHLLGDLKNVAQACFQPRKFPLRTKVSQTCEAEIDENVALAQLRELVQETPLTLLVHLGEIEHCIEVKFLTILAQHGGIPREKRRWCLFVVGAAP